MTLQTRLLSAFGLFALLAAAVGVFALIAVRQLSALATDIYDRPLLTIDYARSAATRFVRLAHQPVPDARDPKQAKALADAIDDLRGDLAVVAQRAGGADTAGLIATAGAALTTWQHVFTAGNDAAQAAAAADAALGALVDHAEEQGYIYRETLTERIDGFVRLTLVILGATVVIGLGLGAWLARRISKPVRAAIGAIDRLAAGDLDAPIGRGGTRRDELGHLMRAIAVFRDQARQLRAIEAEEAARVAATEAARRADLAAVAAGFEISVRGVVDRVTDAAGAVRERARTMRADAEVSSEASAVVAAAAEQTTANVTAVAASVDSLATAIVRINAEVGQAVAVAHSASAEAQEADRSVNGLSEVSARIGEITTLIGLIAKQTNLLALNATIEAARAGAAGRGFAVVATEVKNLAGQTASATQEIGALVSAIQTASTGAVDAIGRIVGTIGRVEAIATSIAGAVDSQTSATDEITRNVHELSGASQEVARTIVALNERACATSQAAAAVLDASSALTDDAATLQAESRRFIVQIQSGEAA